MQAIGERIRHIRGEMDLGVLAGRIGVHKNTLYNYERGTRQPDAGTLVKLLNVFPEANPGWLLTGEGPKGRIVGEVPEGFFLLPSHEISVAGGVKIVSEQIVNHVAFNSNWVQSFLGTPPQDLVLVSVKGDSMEPTLSDGDMVLVDMRANRIEDNAIYVLEFREALLVRRLHRKLDGSLFVKSDNPAYETEILSEESAKGLHVVGRVVWMGRKA